MTDLLEDQIARLAARMLLFAPDQIGLRAIAKPLVGAEVDPLAISTAVASAWKNFERALADDQEHPLAIAKERYALSLLDLDLLLFAALPELDDRFAQVLAVLAPNGMHRRATLGIAMRVLFSEETSRKQI